ncbi:hypothetical protein [Daejeonia sp. YH14]|uniref:hypothetical protein n=1 Tax=Daejeonia sp. YH14 TaxID=3439042 RepID=UPI003F49B1FD
MNLEARKISLVQEFLRIDNEKIISALENFLYKNKSEFFEQNLNPMSLEQFNREIDQALEDEKNNRIISAKDLKQKIQKWS